MELVDFKYAGPPGSPRDSQKRVLNISPTENKMILEQDMHKHQIENLYSCCCFKGSTDRRLLSFMAQFIFSCMIILFSIYQLSVTNNCPCKDTNFNSFYTSILTGIIGVWMPAPKALS